MQRVALVTGASSGVGRETSRALARAGFHVVLASRSLQRLQASASDIRKDAPNATLETRALDLADQSDVRRFLTEFLAERDRLDVLVNNAGLHTARRETTPQGHELTLATNHLGHFTLTMGLLPLLAKSAPARIVNVASEAHRYGSMRWADLHFEKRWSGLLAYTQSKLANILFTRELARRLDGTGVVAHAVHPGSVRTNWARGADSGAFRFVVKVATPFLISPEKGARTSVQAALAPELGETTGAYVVHGKMARPSREARDDEAARLLWERSEQMTGASWPL